MAACSSSATLLSRPPLPPPATQPIAWPCRIDLSARRRRINDPLAPKRSDGGSTVQRFNDSTVQRPPRSLRFDFQRPCHRHKRLLNGVGQPLALLLRFCHRLFHVGLSLLAMKDQLDLLRLKILLGGHCRIDLRKSAGEWVDRKFLRQINSRS